MVPAIMMRRTVGRNLAADALKLSSQPIAPRTSRILQVLTRKSTIPSFIVTPKLVRSYATRSTGTQTTRRKTTSQSRTKKAAPKKKTKKATTKKKQPVKKKAARGRPKKQLTPLELKRQKVNELRKKALLDGPKRLPETAYQVFTSQSIRSGQDGSSQMQQNKGRWKSLSPSETQRYERIASDNKAANQDKYVAWVKQYTPDQVKEANNARRQLSQISKEPKPPGTVRKLVSHGPPPIKDERLVKQPLSPYILFSKDRMASGELNGSIPEKAKAIGREWKSLTASQAQTYHDQHKALVRSYIEDHNRTYKTLKTAAKA